MQIKWLQLILLVFVFSISAQAQTYPEPREQRITRAKDYYQNSFGYNTKGLCTGPMCFPVGSKISCSKYSYINGHTPGTKVQFCHISKIKNTHGTTEVDVANNYTMSTGFVDASGTFIAGVPTDEFFNADMNGRLIAFTPSTRTEGREQLPCDSNCGNNTVTDLANTVLDTITPSSPPTPAAFKKQVGDAFERENFAGLCNNFISKDGSLGPWGKEAVKSFKDVCNECFFGANSVNVKALCPKFNNFSQVQKEYFWSWTLASMSHFESSCRTNVRVRGTKVRGHQEYAIGLLQLEESTHRRKTRGPECRSSSSLFNTSFQFRCAASIIRDTRWEDGKPLWGAGGQYWQKLRGLGGETGRISGYISKFPGCK